MSVRVISAYFVDIYKDGSGGAIAVSDKQLLVSFSFFTNMSASLHGGSIFCNNSYCTIKKTCFYRSYSTKHEDNAGRGNAIYFTKYKITCDNINTRRCGPSSDLGCDSAIILIDCLVKNENYNASSNYGIGGTAGISVMSNVDDSFVKFMNVVDAYDSSAIESSRIYNVYYSNFINTKGCLRSFLWESGDNQINFVSCIFIQTHSTFSSWDRKYSAENCVSDESISLITYQENPKTNFITIKIINKCSIAKRQSKSQLIFQFI